MVYVLYGERRTTLSGQSCQCCIVRVQVRRGQRVGNELDGHKAISINLRIAEEVIRCLSGHKHQSAHSRRSQISPIVHRA